MKFDEREGRNAAHHAHRVTAHGQLGQLDNATGRAGSERNAVNELRLQDSAIANSAYFCTLIACCAEATVWTLADAL